MKKYIFLLLFSLLLITSCENEKDTEIIILTTNDMHGQIDNFGKLAAYLKKLRTQHKHVYLFSAGDIFSGNPLVDQYPEKGYPIIDIMNKVGYQLSTFGNHEFDYGTKILAERLRQAEFPFILANATVTDKSLSLPQFKPYITLDINGIKMTIFSVIETGSGNIPSVHPDKVKGISFSDPVKKALEFKDLRNNCDIFIALTHLGFDYDVKLAKAMPQLDIILGGHSHTRIDTGKLINGVLITQSDEYMKYAGQTEIKIKNGKIISKKNNLINLNKLTDTDAGVQKLIDNYKEHDPGNIVIGKTLTDIKGKEALGALMTDAITEELNLDIALQNAGGIRIAKLKKGNITINNIYELDPFENEIIKVDMTGAEIKALIESTLRRTKGSTKPDLLISGFTYQATVKTKTGETLNLNMKDKNGKAIDMKHVYSVGMNSYIYTKHRFKHADPGTSLHIISSQVLIDYIKKKQTLSGYDTIQRIKISLSK